MSSINHLLLQSWLLTKTAAFVECLRTSYGDSVGESRKCISQLLCVREENAQMRRRPSNGSAYHYSYICVREGYVLYYHSSYYIMEGNMLSDLYPDSHLCFIIDSSDESGLDMSESGGMTRGYSDASGNAPPRAWQQEGEIADCKAMLMPMLNINYFRHFLDILRNYKPVDDEPMWAAEHVIAPTPGSAITILETVKEFAIKALFDRLLKEIQAFSQHENESLTDAWLRMKEMLRNCHGHNLSKGNIIKIFYHGLSEITQEVLNAAAGGIFLYKTPNQVYQLLEDKVLLKLDWS
nr:reverse transcriptase domain-containing protein [Tanacetum cinerariifolium]